MVLVDGVDRGPAGSPRGQGYTDSGFGGAIRQHGSDGEPKAGLVFANLVTASRSTEEGGGYLLAWCGSSWGRSLGSRAFSLRSAQVDPEGTSFYILDEAVAPTSSPLPWDMERGPRNGCGKLGARSCAGMTRPIEVSVVPRVTIVSSPPHCRNQMNVINQNISLIPGRCPKTIMYHASRDKTTAG